MIVLVSDGKGIFSESDSLAGMVGDVAERFYHPIVRL